MKFRSKQKVVEANQFNPPATAPIGVLNRADGVCYVVTARGEPVTIRAGDWVVLEDPPGDGTRAYPIAPKAFEANFEPEPVTAKKDNAPNIAGNIDLTRPIKTRCGFTVHIYEVLDGLIHGRVYSDDTCTWSASDWSLKGDYKYGCGKEHPWDLVNEPKPKRVIEVTRYVNAYENGMVYFHDTKQGAEEFCADKTRIACKMIAFTIVEGEGLDG